MIYTAGIFLINHYNEILVVHPTNSHWNNWSIPKGLIDENETAEEAAKRELYEETNVNIEDLRLVFFREGEKVKYGSGKKTLCPFFAKVINIESIDLKCNSKVDGADFYENDQIVWMPIEKALVKIHEAQRQALSQYVNQLL